MLSGRTVSIEHLMEILHRDYGFSDISKDEVAEWIYTSMSLIGTPYVFKDVPVQLSIINYRARLPVNLYSIVGVREHTTGIAMREMTDIFNKFGDSIFETEEEIIADYDPAYPGHVLVGGTTTLDPYYETVVGPGISSEYFTYKTQGDYIYTGLEDGEIEMVYKAFPIDLLTGMPTIPDNVKYIRGVVSYVAERIAFRMMLKDQLQKDKYDLIRTEYFFNVGAAQSECVMPDVSRMETLLNRWKSTYLGPEHFDTGFKYLGSRE
jgi:hypothetical protein